MARSERSPGAAAPETCERLLLGMAGSIAVAELGPTLRWLRRAFASRIDVIMTAAAQRFVAPEVVQRQAGGDVFTDPFDRSAEIEVAHIDLPRQADLMVVMPATANVLAKAAHGICDDLLTTAIVASDDPVVFVPSMNGSMWTRPIVQRNVGLVRELGHVVLDPAPGIAVDLEASLGGIPPVAALLERFSAVLRERRARGP